MTSIFKFLISKYDNPWGEDDSASKQGPRGQKGNNGRGNDTVDVDKIVRDYQKKFKKYADISLVQRKVIFQ